MSNWHALHFNKIAKVIRDKRKDAKKIVVGDLETQLNELTLEFAEYFAEQNPIFNTNKFIKACGYDVD